MEEDSIDKSFRQISLRLLQIGKTPEDVIKKAEEAVEIDDIVTQHICLKPLQQHLQHENMLITYGYIKGETPSWAKAYGINDDHAKQLIFQRPYCLLFVKFKVDEYGNSQSSADSNIGSQNEGHRWMVITNGCGHQMLELEFMEHGFGLYTSLNTINPEQITNMAAKTAGGKMQSFAGFNPKGGKHYEFRMQKMDVLKRMAGKVTSDEGANTEINISGCDMLKVRFKSNISLEDLSNLCERYYKKYHKKTYQDVYPFLLDIVRIRKKKIEEILNEKLIHSIQQFLEDIDEPGFEASVENVELVYPLTDKLINDGHIKFMNFGNKTKTKYDGLSLKNYLEEIKKNPREMEIFNDKSNPDKIIKLLEKHVVFLCDEKKKWSVKRCISYDTVHQEKRYILQDGTWYRISSNLIKTVTKYFNDRCKIKSILPPYNKNIHKAEGGYNISAASEMGYLCMDAKNLQFQGSNKFEICDMLSNDGKLLEMIHVKIDKGNTSNIGHLFNQGLISSSYLYDENIRKQIYDKIIECGGKEGIKYANLLAQVERNPKNINVSFAVIEKEPKTCKDRSQNSFSLMDDKSVKLLNINCLILFHIASNEIEKRFRYTVTFEWVKNETFIKSETPEIDVQSDENLVQIKDADSNNFPVLASSLTDSGYV